MVKSSLLGRVFTLCLVYVPNIKQDAFLDGFVFILPSSENFTPEADLNLTVNFPVDISDTRSQEFYSLGPFLTGNTTQPGVSAEQVLPSLKIYLFYSHNHLVITPVYCLSLSGSSQDSLTGTKRGQMTWSISLSASTTRRDSLVSQRRRKRELNNCLFNSFLALVFETSKNQICFHNGMSPSSSFYGICTVVLKRKLIEKTSGRERGENAEHRFLISEIKNLEVYENIGAKKMLNNLLFPGHLLHILVSEKTVCILYRCRQKYSKTEKKRHAVTVYKVRSQRENRIIIAARKQNSKIHSLLRTRAREVLREVRLQVKVQHLKGESEGTKSSEGPDPERLPMKLYKALKDCFLPKVTDLICYFLGFKPLADTLKEADNLGLKARRDKGGFSSHRDTPPLAAECRRSVAVPTAALESVSPNRLHVAAAEVGQRRLLLDSFRAVSIMRRSDLVMLKSGILFPLKRDMSCGHLQWKFRKEILIEAVRTKWSQVALCKLLEPAQLSRQPWNGYSLLPISFALFVSETMLSLNEILLVIQAASNPLHLRTFQLLKLIIPVHKLCDFDIQVKMRSGYKFILRWSNGTESTG